MENRSFVALLAGASAVTFAGVFFAIGTPEGAVVTPPPVIEELATIAPPAPRRIEMPETVSPGTDPTIANLSGRRGGRRASRSTGAASVYYPGCNQVRALGRAPLYRGDPGYRPEMDGDNDGIACEPRL